MNLYSEYALRFLLYNYYMITQYMIRKLVHKVRQKQINLFLSILVHGFCVVNYVIETKQRNYLHHIQLHVSTILNGNQLHIKAI